ncbi:predicted protein [Streptomyces sp. C]|nr:predicted protein [Streptomyces sp. C]
MQPSVESSSMTRVPGPLGPLKHVTLLGDDGPSRRGRGGGGGGLRSPVPQGLEHRAEAVPARGENWPSGPKKGPRCSPSGSTAATPPRWRTGRDGVPVHVEGTATDVARRGPDGRWRYAIDNPFGPGAG